MAIVKSTKRIKAENDLIALFDMFDPSKYNSDQYRILFDTMTEKEFAQYMNDIVNDNQYVSFEVKTSEKDLTLDKIFDICNKNGIKTHKYVKYRDNTSKDGSCMSITPYPSLILYVTIKRLQQMVSKKNSATGDIDVINPLTGTVPGESKGAGLNDTQSFGLVSTNQRSVLKELLGPRADDEHSKKQMLNMIREKGDVSLSDLNIEPRNKQSTETMRIFMRAAGIEVKIS